MRTRELHRRAKELALPFVPQEQVRWLEPGELARTVGKVVLGVTFADYLDKREIQGALDAKPLRAPLDSPDATETWFDYAADLGDGFDATSSVAWTLAQDHLAVQRPQGGPSRLPRGSLLVLGGDEVYPVASAEAYENRTTGPYRAALPTGPGPLMVALPGNHDWYDGLTSFLRVFAQQRDIGGWRTRQTRSYFVVQLPQGWWLAGLDSQFESYFDEPQLRFFETHLSSRLRPGDGVIVCSAVPAWVKCAEGDPDAFEALHWFDRNIVRTRLTDRETGARTPTGASVRLWLTGDRHHYARYAELLPTDPPDAREPPPDASRRQMLTCGLGGAYLTATHRLPERLRLPPPEARLREKDDPADFCLAPRTHPSRGESRGLARRIAQPWKRFWLTRRNPGFGLLTGGLHIVLFLLAALLLGASLGTGPVEAVRTAGWADVLRFAGAFAAVVAAVTAVPWLVRPARRRPGPAGGPRTAAPGRPPRPAVAVVLQAVVALLTLVAAASLPFPPGWPGWTVLLLCLLLAGVVGALAGSEAFALWLLSARHGTVCEWQMSGQSVDDHKGFLRIRIAPDGTLTVHPLLLDGVCRDWEVTKDPAGGGRPVPVRLPSVSLIEEPVVIAREARKP
ncbi:metallophosphoesterase family protein [Streptomyces fragilis]|uniref:Metallophosphoesterase n=1 Tax=Streptomyces fragilis TaxID=67301 RepID=A0ABV2YJ65_9ACTN|nr:hypothetical protein [Streptomyces fragilis]